MLLTKRLLSAIIFPINVSFGLLLLGLLFLWLTKRQRTGKALVTAGTLTFALFGYDCSTDRMLGGLERRHPAVMQLPADATAGEDPVRWVVVLGSGQGNDPNMPATSDLNPSALGRLIEGIRLHRLLPSTKLLLSGGPGFGPVPHAHVLVKAAESLGVARDQIVVEPRPQDTEQEAKLIVPRVGKDRIYLVTSALHMPRALGLFTAAGARALPAPADFLVRGVPKDARFDPDGLYPNGRNFVNASRAIHEYVGMIWSRMRGTL